MVCLSSLGELERADGHGFVCPSLVKSGGSLTAPRDPQHPLDELNLRVAMHLLQGERRCGLPWIFPSYNVL